MQNFDAIIVVLVVLRESENRVILQPNLRLSRQNDVAQPAHTLLLIERITTSNECVSLLLINSFHVDRVFVVLRPQVNAHGGF